MPAPWGAGDTARFMELTRTLPHSMRAQRSVRGLFHEGTGVGVQGGFTEKVQPEPSLEGLRRAHQLENRGGRESMLGMCRDAKPESSKNDVRCNSCKRETEVEKN